MGGMNNLVKLKSHRDVKIAIIGLGYVGLPLAVEFGKQYQTVGFDIDNTRIEELTRGVDRTLETNKAEIEASKQLHFTNSVDELKECDVYIVTVPTPIDSSNRPNLNPLVSASKLVASVITGGNVVIYESTVYPGCTEEICIPEIEKESGLVFNQDFFSGYSPERINPGDKERRLINILKVTSGSTEQVAEFVDSLYKQIIKAGTHLASSIKVAEACKVIENVQRDVNIGLVNELAMIFERLQINTEDVLEAAGTKWNFLPFRPGLVGGHCIGVDPYYLVHKAESAGYHPDIISASRRINDSMGKTVAQNVMRLMTLNRIHIVDANILVLGLAFKENCPDLRNTRVIDIVEELTACNAKVDVYDPWVSHQQAEQEFQLQLVTALKENYYDAVIVAVAHNQFVELGVEGVRKLICHSGILYDIKYIFPADLVDGRL